jgi:hypothetical protein
MDWFRMYHEFASDAKVQSMSEAMQRRLLMLFCLRCSNTLETLHDDEIAFALRISADDLSETKALFLRKNFVNDEWEILQWDARQFVSDSSSVRVKKHRAKKKLENENAPTNPSNDSSPDGRNVTVTPQNRTDTEQNRIKPLAQNPAGFARFWAAYPKRKSKGAAEKAFKAIKPSEQVLEEILQAITRATTSFEWLKDGGQFIPHPATWLRARGWEDEISTVTTSDGDAKGWWQSSSGVIAKGKEYGLEQTELVFALFRDRVYLAAGDGPWRKERRV